MIQVGTFIPSPLAIQPAAEEAILGGLAAGAFDGATASVLIDAVQPLCAEHGLLILTIWDEQPCCVVCARERERGAR